MTNPSPWGRRAPSVPTLPRGDVLGTYASYPEAQAVVERLSHADFPIKQLAIIGNELTTVERVTGRLTYGRAALAGAVSGAGTGAIQIRGANSAATRIAATTDAAGNRAAVTLLLPP